MIRFRLFSVPITITAFFWLGAILLGLGDVSGPGLVGLALWVPVVLVSILVHEMGHAFAVMWHGIGPAVTLHAMGGVTTYDEPVRGRLNRAIVSLAGPGAGFVLGGLVYAVGQMTGPLPGLAGRVMWQLLWVNLGWGLFNLVPVLPFDGGHVLEEILGPRRARTTALVSLIVAVAATALCYYAGQTWGAILFAMSAVQSYQLYTLPPGAVLVNPFAAPAAPAGARQGGGPGPLRRWWLQRKLGRLQREADALREERPVRRRAGGPELRVIQGGAAPPPKDKRYLN